MLCTMIRYKKITLVNISLCHSCNYKFSMIFNSVTMYVTCRVKRNEAKPPGMSQFDIPSSNSSKNK